MAEKQSPDAFAYQLFAHVVDEHGDADADLHLAKVIAALFELSPIAREHISDLFFADLSDELSRRGEAEAVRAILEAQKSWDREA